MRWLGLRHRHDAIFGPKGLDHRGPVPPPDEDSLVTRGTVLVEVSLTPADRPTNLVRYSVLDPWPASLSLVHDPDGTFHLLMRQGPRHLSAALRTRLAGRTDRVILTYNWDAPRRRGVLGVYVPDTRELWQTPVPNPFPMTLRDLGRMTRDTTACRLAAGVCHVALGQGTCPIGPMPGLDPTALITTPEGDRPLSALRAGDRVLDTQGVPRRVRWARSVTLPTAGSQAPLRLRAPYHGLGKDMILAPDQRLLLSGSEVEYLFGQERVSVPARHLADRYSVAPASSVAPIFTYRQVLLDRPAAILANGATVESFDAQPLFSDARLVSNSVLADLPRADWPERAGGAAPVLRAFEALSLKEPRYG
ncbi:Hint domain-containing protein [Salibaculum sp.]|uniref:Hint domain-containing protein n=1 Tax=Salibaculum sp. TaxID=2855480 RepID=UPI002B470B11|nr:Hint domain-containing protein [Salibaculum sp.]HKL68053.1 Hint domain-containing protein [Salibaculum sp.]